MATYKLAPALGKPPPAYALTKRARRASMQGAAAMRRAAAGRTWQRGRAAAPLDLHPGPHPLPVELIDATTLTGSAKGLVTHAVGQGLAVRAATNGRDLEVRIGRLGDAGVECIGRVVFRGGRLVHAFALAEGPRYVKVTLTALRAALTEAAP